LPDEDRKDPGVVKASVYMGRKEYVWYKVDAAKVGSKVSRYLLRLIRIGKAALDYDWRDFLAVLRGKKPDREWIMEEVEALEKRTTSLREYYELLLDQKKACREGRRYLEIKEDILNEKIDDLEHMLEG
jgi:hypothetical protein